MTSKRIVTIHSKPLQGNRNQNRDPNVPGHQRNAMKRPFEVRVLFSLALVLFLCGDTAASTTAFTASLGLYADETYSTKSSNPNLKTDQRIYLQVDTDLAADTAVKVVLHQCWGTPSPAPNDPENLVIIENTGCPTDVIPTRVSVNGEEIFSRFDYQVFKFRSSAFITVHCIVKLCINNCKPSCSSRRKRQTEGDDPETETEMISATFQVVNDPISPHELLPPHNVSIQTEAPQSTTAVDEIEEKNEGPLTDVMLIIIGVLAGALLIICALAVMLVRFKLRRQKKKREKLEKSVDVYSIIQPTYYNT